MDVVLAIAFARMQHRGVRRGAEGEDKPAFSREAAARARDHRHAANYGECNGLSRLVSQRPAFGNRAALVVGLRCRLQVFLA